MSLRDKAYTSPAPLYALKATRDTLRRQLDSALDDRVRARRLRRALDAIEERILFHPKSGW